MKEQKRSKDFDRMIIEAVQGHYSFFAWQSIGGVVEKCELKIKAYRKDYNEIELEACPGEEDRLGLVISGNRVLNIYVPESSISFHIFMLFLESSVDSSTLVAYRKFSAVRK